MDIKEVSIIKTVSKNVYLIKCNFCQGKGLQPQKMVTLQVEEWEITGWDKEACPICLGKGLVEVTSPDILVYDGVCHGTGHKNKLDPVLTAFIACESCRGLGVRSLTGEIPPTSPIIQTLGPNTYLIHCSFCGKTGKKPLTVENECPSPKDFYGLSVKDMILKGDWVAKDWHPEPCPICDGKAVLKIECPDLLLIDAVCKGSGHNILLYDLEAEDTEALERSIADSQCPKCQGLGVRSLTGEIKHLK